MVAFKIFGFPIYWYGIFYFIAFLIGYKFFGIIKKKALFNNYLNLKKLFFYGIEDIFMYLILGVLIGGRLGYVFFYDFSYFLQNPLKIFFLWEGGMSFVGGTIGVILAGIMLYRKFNLNKKEFLLFMDTVVSIIPFGLMLGRIGNFLNQELYGKTIENLLPSLSQNIINLGEKIYLFFIYSNVDAKLRINSNLIEAFFEGVILLIILQILFWQKTTKNRLKPGILGVIFLILYGIFRFLAEFLRYYPTKDYFHGLTISQYFMIFYIFIGIILYIIFSKQNTKE